MENLENKENFIEEVKKWTLAENVEVNLKPRTWKEEQLSNLQINARLIEITENCGLRKCNKEGKLRCQYCKIYKYCSEAHQDAHWNEHSIFCKQTKIDEKLDDQNVETIKYVKANFDMRKGFSFINQELPLLVVPNLKESFYEKIDLVTCIDCCKVYSLAESNLINLCEGCEWPICINDCDPKISLHNDEECRLLANSNWLKERSYFSLSVLKCALLKIKKSDRISYIKLRKLNNYFKDKEENSELMSNVNFLNEMFLLKHFPYSFEKNELFEDAGILLSSYLPFRSPEFPLERDALIYYNQSSFYRHSCFPNVSYFTINNFRSVYTIERKIESSSEMTISYFECPFWPTFERRVIIKTNFNFICHCERCEDVTELGTYFIGIPCPYSIDCKICCGFLLPKCITNVNGNWECTECKISASGEAINFIYFCFYEYIKVEVYEDSAMLKINKNLNRIVLTEHFHHTNFLIFQASMYIINWLRQNFHIYWKEYARAYFEEFWTAGKSVLLTFNAFLPNYQEDDLATALIINLGKLQSDLFYDRITIQDLERYLGRILSKNRRFTKFRFYKTRLFLPLKHTITEDVMKIILHNLIELAIIRNKSDYFFNMPNLNILKKFIQENVSEELCQQSMDLFGSTVNFIAKI